MYNFKNLSKLVYYTVLHDSFHSLSLVFHGTEWAIRASVLKFRSNPCYPKVEWCDFNGASGRSTPVLTFKHKGMQEIKYPPFKIPKMSLEFGIKIALNCQSQELN